MTYLLSMPAMHAADPDCLPVIFGPDGSFLDAPNFQGPVLIPHYGYVAVACAPTPAEPYWDRMVLDARMPTVAARLLIVCQRAVDAVGDSAARSWRDLRFEDLLIHDWTEGRAARLASHVASMAADIGALRRK